MPEGGEALIVRAILEDAAGDGDAIPFPADAVGLPEAIAATLRDLPEGMIEADDLRKADIPDRKGECLATGYASFTEKLEGFIDRPATLEKADQAADDELGRVASGAAQAAAKRSRVTAEPVVSCLGAIIDHHSSFVGRTGLLTTRGMST